MITRTAGLLMICLLALAAFWRVLPHPDNMTPAMAVALFAGIWLRPLWLRIGAPLGVMLVSDLVLGFHDTMVFVYGAMLVPILIGPFLRGRGVGSYAAVSVASSLSFFAITNLGVWLLSGLYPRSLEGLTQCFAMAVPFLWKTLAGDLFFTLLFLGLFMLAGAGARAADATGSRRPA